MNDNVTGIILAGGESSRMGMNKALLNVGGKKTIERIRNIMAPLCEEVMVVSDESALYHFLQVPITNDIFPGKGPLAGIHAGLSASKNEWNLVAACDMPLIDQAVIKVLAAEANEHPEADVILPAPAGKDQPLCAVYNKRSLSVISEALKNNELKLQQVFSQLQVAKVTEEQARGYGLSGWGRSFYNMNYPEEYDYICKILADGDF
ncbi:molybdenum cofactor guanylyltransferase [Bacillus sp. H-16]|uniref:molybdenum cofactor guanylyltransferase n=1 Tax=Alteribacter salitolerans TaxID=2912333 RepID=UPI0019658A85|nr:molybdenum cofactor guanylyltransferase [Alteribacter salitolerans]MBM7096337.1 molybdenum cofactor guanylyltransferase [Alteribacter salitolerans]